MIFNDDVMFIHVPKTGGMSVTAYLLNNLPGQIYLTVPEEAFEHARSRAMFPDVYERLNLLPGTRHEDLAAAKQVAAGLGRRLQDFKLILAIVRNPYDLEVSYYCHLRKERIRKEGELRRTTGSRSAPLAWTLAAAGDFETFARQAPYYGRLPSRIERYYSIRGQTPANMKIVRLEDIDGGIRALAPYTKGRCSLPHHNRTIKRAGWRDYITPASEAAIYEKYRYLFSFYPRESADMTDR